MAQISEILVKVHGSSIHEGSLSMVHLPGYELWMTFIKNVHVVPIRVDLDRFVRALSDTVLAYPHTAGRLKSYDSTWNIELCYSAIPLQIEYMDTLTLGISNRAVVQENISRFLNSVSLRSNPINTDTPLLFFKLSLTESETAIGVSWHHTLGDATLLLRFMRQLSQSYQHLFALNDMPTFDKYDFPVPTSEQINEYSPLMPHLAQAQETSSLGALYARMNQKLACVTFRFSRNKLSLLRDAVQRERPDAAYTPSIQDCLTAYIVTLLGRCSGMAIQMITNAASYRNVPAPFIAPNVAGNAIYIVPTIIGEEHSLVDVAYELRYSMMRSRELEFVRQYMSVASYQMLVAANSGRSLFFSSGLRMLSVNSNLALDWQSVDFGSPGHAYFFTSGVNMRYLRVFRSNQVGNDTHDAVEICLGVHANIAEHVRSTLATEVGSTEFPVNLMMLC